jgi:hypothetical protein
MAVGVVGVDGPILGFLAAIPFVAAASALIELWGAHDSPGPIAVGAMATVLGCWWLLIDQTRSGDNPSSLPAVLAVCVAALTTQLLAARAWARWG